LEKVLSAPDSGCATLRNTGLCGKKLGAKILQLVGDGPRVNLRNDALLWAEFKEDPKRIVVAPSSQTVLDAIASQISAVHAACSAAGPTLDRIMQPRGSIDGNNACRLGLVSNRYYQQRDSVSLTICNIN